MAVIPSMDDWSAHEKPSAAKMNANIRDVGNFLLNDRPMAFVVGSTVSTQNLPTGTDAQFATVSLDTDNMVDLGTSSTRITFNTPGFYQVGSYFAWTEPASGLGAYREPFLRKNGTDLITRFNVLPMAATFRAAYCLSSIVYANAGDYMTVCLFHDASNTIVTNITAGGINMWAMWLTS